MSNVVRLQKVIESAATAPGNGDRLLEISGWDHRFVGWGGKDQDIYKMGDFYPDVQSLYTYIYLIHPTNTGRKQLLYTKIDNTIKSRRKAN